MIKLWQAALLAATLAPATAMAQSGFNGTWKLDTRSAKYSGKPDAYLLKDGVFTCTTCAPAYSVKADGSPHPVTGSPYYDHLSVTVLGPNAIHSVRTKAGRMTGEAVQTVSADGSTLTFAFNDLTVPATPVKGTYTETRVAPPPPGAHMISGSWRQTGFDATDNGLLVSFVIKDGMVSYSTPSGQSYTVKLNGPPGPLVGDPGVDTVSVASSAPNQMVERDFRHGQLVSIETSTLAPDGQTAVLVVEDKLHGTTSQMTFLKQ